MQYKKVTLTFVTLILTFAAVGFAQGTKPPPKPGTGRFGDPTGIARKYQSYLYGVIKKISKEELILEKTKFGVDTTIKLLPKTQYIYDQKSGTLDQLKVGDQVYVDVNTDKKTGDMSAKKVVSGIMSTS